MGGGPDVQFGLEQPSVLGRNWTCMHSTTDKVPFRKRDFQNAMLNLIREPNINSTAILRADILREVSYQFDVECQENKLLESKCRDLELTDTEAKVIRLNDLELRTVTTTPDMQLVLRNGFVRRMIPRNPYKDAIINQSCLVLNSPEVFPETILVAYVPHIEDELECPFYIPHVQAVGILLHEGILSVHYIPYANTQSLLKNESERVVRTAMRLLQTSYKHSKGVMDGYQKRVQHDQVVDRIRFQDCYILLKKKYSKFLVDNWAESTDPKKHVFEDIAIAAFLLELWANTYGPEFKQKMQFRDLGCGNGALCYILIQEGITGMGIDARHRKSWAIYPPKVQACLKEQAIVPSILLRPHPELKKRVPELEHNGALFPVKVMHEVIAPATVVYSSEDLLNSPQVNITEFPRDTFIIGNHSDELTCWIPLLGYPFMVIPCCSHNLSGDRMRYNVRKENTSATANSAYAGLVSHVEHLAKRVGWEVEKEMLRIPSTRNAAIIGRKNRFLRQFPTAEVYNVLMEDGGALGWIQNTMALMTSRPRSH